jgi:hypothetical protein
LCNNSTENYLKINTCSDTFLTRNHKPMSNTELQSGSAGDFELQQGVNSLQSSSEGICPNGAGVGKTRRFTKLAAIAAMLTAAGCGPDGANTNDTAVQYKPEKGNSVEKMDQFPQIQLQFSGEKQAALSVFFMENKIYDFKLTSYDNPADIITLTTSGEKVELLQGVFHNPTSGYKVEAFDENGKPVPINFSRKPGTIYGPDHTI